MGRSAGSTTIAESLCVSCKADLAAKQEAAKPKARKGSASSPKVTKVAQAKPKARKVRKAQDVLEGLRSFVARLQNPAKAEFAGLMLEAYEGGEDLPNSDGSPAQDYVVRKWERYTANVAS